eukprot:5481728-Alexandrium_andersonii.AAC.1
MRRDAADLRAALARCNLAQHLDARPWERPPCAAEGPGLPPSRELWQRSPGTRPRCRCGAL